jgi:hypothetical protein
VGFRMVFSEDTELVQLWGKFLPDIDDDDFYGFYSKAVNKSDITDFFNILKGF